MSWHVLHVNVRRFDFWQIASIHEEGWLLFIEHAWLSARAAHILSIDFFLSYNKIN